MLINNLLPIGSVVMLKGGEKRLMVFGVMQTDAVDENTVNDYDYIGVLYPEGSMGTEFQYLFNHEDITEIIHRGFEDEEREKFIEQLEKVYASGVLTNALQE